MRHVIRVAVLDDHPVVLAGLRRLLERTPDLLPVGAAATPEELWRALDAADADVVVVDYDPDRGDGLAVCRQLKRRANPPAVVVYSAYAGAALSVAARIASADALVDKRSPVRDLLDAIGRAAAGETVIAEVAPDVRETALGRLAPEEVPVAVMLLGGAPRDAVAQALGIDRREVGRRVRRIVAKLRPRTLPAHPPAVPVGGDER